MLHLSFSRVGALTCAAAFAACATAIVIRHDRPDARHLELANEFAAYGDVVEAGSTLIASRWLLTAAHVAKEITPYTSFATVGGRRYAIDRVILHPDYVKAGLRGPRDLALLRLTEDVVGVEPIRLYTSSDETGQIVTFFGRGKTGDGITGPTNEDGKMRGATNKVESANETSIRFRFNPPETATDLEGISGPGDSGGPAMLKLQGKWAIAGVSSANSGSGKSLCTYGTIEVYARVSTAVDWIESTMKAPPPSTIQWRATAPFMDWPKTKAGAIAPALIDVINSGNPTSYESFCVKYLDPQALDRATPEARAEGFAGVLKKFGKLTIVERSEDGNGRLVVLLRDENGKYLQLSLYFFDKGNTRFDGFWLGEAARS